MVKLTGHASFFHQHRASTFSFLLFTFEVACYNCLQQLKVKRFAQPLLILFPKLVPRIQTSNYSGNKPERGARNRNKIWAKRDGRDFCWEQLEWVEEWGITLTHRPPHKAGSLSRSGTQRLAQLAVPEHTGHHLPPSVPISTHAHHIQIHQALLARWTRSLLLVVMLGDQIQCWSFTGKWLPHWSSSSSL